MNLNLHNNNTQEKTETQEVNKTSQKVFEIINQKKSYTKPKRYYELQAYISDGFENLKKEDYIGYRINILWETEEIATLYHKSLKNLEPLTNEEIEKLANYEKNKI